MIQNILEAARSTLGFEIAFVSQFMGDERVFRYVDGIRVPNHVVREGASGPLQGSYCKLVIEGRLPALIPDTHLNPITRAMAVTQAAPIRAHASVPIRLSDGTVFGTFCCVSDRAHPELDHKDLAALQAFADLAAVGIEQDLVSDRSRAAKEQRVSQVIASGGPTVVYQPVFLLDGLNPVGAEALSRFPGFDNLPVDGWFKDAAEVGLQVEMELCAIANALDGYRAIWDRHRVQLGLNVSATTMQDERLATLLDDYPHDRLVLELTEHEEVQDYPALIEATTRLRGRGTKIAVDDLGAGFASMRHVLSLRPDILKLDVGLTRAIDTDELKHALASSMKQFADRCRCSIVAEGVETEGELKTLQQLGLQAAQGYLLGRPNSAETLLALLDRTKALRPDDPAVTPRGSRASRASSRRSGASQQRPAPITP